MENSYSEKDDNLVENKAVEEETTETVEEETAETTEFTETESILNENVKNNKDKKFNFQKITKNPFFYGTAVFLIAFVVVLIVMCVGNKNNRLEIDSLYDANNLLIQENDSLEKENSKLKAKVDDLENGPAAMLVEIKNDFEKGNWQKVIDKAAELHKKNNGCKEDVEAQDLAQQSQAKLDEEAAAKAAKEAQGYETGITYDQLARTPDNYLLQKVKFSGKVLQVIEGDKDSNQLRLAVDGNYDTVLYVEYNAKKLPMRILEDDYITVYGFSMGTISYKSTLGATITIPSVIADRVDQ